MRVAIIGAVHYHTPYHLNPLLELPNVKVVGISDPDIDIAQQYASKAGCPAFADYQDMCFRLKPDIVFTFGRHCDMAEEVRFLIAEKIPFVVEKPASTTLDDANDIARRAAAAKSFAAVPLTMRYSGLAELIAEAAPGETVRYMSFRFAGGLLRRYPRLNSDWMLSRKSAGGGPLINFGMHVFDQINYILKGKPLNVTGAAMSNHLGKLDIEDHALVMLRGDGVTCEVTTSYVCPPRKSPPNFDLQYAIRTDKHYFLAKDHHSVEVLGDDEKIEDRPIQLMDKAFYYPTFVADTLRRLESGQPPIANLQDAANVMALVQGAYNASPLAA